MILSYVWVFYISEHVFFKKCCRRWLVSTNYTYAVLLMNGTLWRELIWMFWSTKLHFASLCNAIAQRWARCFWHFLLSLWYNRLLALWKKKFNKDNRKLSGMVWQSVQWEALNFMLKEHLSSIIIEDVFELMKYTILMNSERSSRSQQIFFYKVSYRLEGKF